MQLTQKVITIYKLLRVIIYYLITPDAPTQKSRNEDVRVLRMVVLLVGYEERECKSIINLLGERKKLGKKLMFSSS